MSRAIATGILLWLWVAPASSQSVVTQATLDHVAIQVSDLQRSVDFYEELFGLKEQPAPFAGARWLALGNGVMLHLVGNRTAPSDHSRWDHIALSCDDMDEMIKRLDAHHIVWSNMNGGHEPQVRPDGIKQIFIQDPDGYWIEINDMLKRRR
ncbi:VOC family protein [Edaphosphingomonas haloaromaticamans]|uniref:Glyoxalase-like domain protein n=1 Tax=Edaphosphingomonas haloaromaticamans TaxID=653954 RepID=A0A1S1HI52_9SPHN|nr:VOC family protein [Sphingomonas haloaromaticamans]OHT21757.1 Glyoxalase-like domain protein [Sphingomonas haloaromaticamans]